MLISGHSPPHTVRRLRAFRLPPVRYRFGAGSSPDKFRGLNELGPYQAPQVQQPTFAFVFPTECRDHANKLYGALKNGVGYFKGLQTAFRLPLTKSQVFPISQFSLQNIRSTRDAARRYSDAILEWTAKNDHSPDLFFVIHPRTSDWLDQTPYYECKALLLTHGLLSQHVTTDLIDSSSQFDWSVANIALQAFAKLGGLPWIIDSKQDERNVVLGVGNTSIVDPVNRQTRRYIGFTACFSASGAFRFLTVGKVAKTREEYLSLLSDVTQRSLERVAREGNVPEKLTLHLNKQASREELQACERAVQSVQGPAARTQIRIVRVNESPAFWAVDPADPDGIPSRGTVIHMGDNDYLMYTEGREERQAWRNRTPTCVRMMPQAPDVSLAEAEALLMQTHQLSMVNWRGFNANAKPITTFYGAIVARVLSHVPTRQVSALYEPRAKAVLEERMWFL